MWAGQSISLVGDQVSLFALPSLAILVLDATGPQVGVLHAMATIAFPALGLFVGAFMDHVRCRPFMIGADLLRLVSAEGMAVDGRLEIWGHTDRTLSPPPHYIETSVAFSAEPLHPDLDDYAAAVCKALGYRNGPFHFEAVPTDTGPVLVEINTRLVGAGIHRAIDLATGVSCAEQVLRGYLGLPLLPPRAHGAACLAHLTIPSDGRIDAVEGIDAARTSPGVHDVVCSVTTGDTVTITGSNTDRLCYVLATGESRHETRRAARNAAGKIGITTGPYA